MPTPTPPATEPATTPATDWPHLPRRQGLPLRPVATPAPRTTTLPPGHTTQHPPGRSTDADPGWTRGLHHPESRHVLWRTMSLGTTQRRLRLAELAHWAGRRSGYQQGYQAGWRGASMQWALLGALCGAAVTAALVELTRWLA